MFYPEDFLLKGHNKLHTKMENLINLTILNLQFLESKDT